MGKDAPAAGSGADGRDPAELARFNRLADRFRDAEGPMRPLHLLNPLRLDYILEQVGAHRRAQPTAGAARSAAAEGRSALAGLSALDVGCGAGLLTEPLCRLGAEVTGLDAAADLLEVARVAAGELELAIDYRLGTAETLTGEGRTYDLVTALEVIEHVPDPHAFVGSLASLAAPGGVVVLSTLSRTLRSLVLAKGAAEYLLGLLPRGTHDWRRFIGPARLGQLLRDAGLRPVHLTGVAFDPAYERFRRTRDSSINYMMTAVRA